VDGVTAGTTREPVTVGPYRLVRKLGEGGMGVVHLALDPGGRPVALKVLRPHVAHDEEARKRLGREVANLRRVRHPLIAEVIDADVDGDRPYLVTRFVPGRSLEAEVRDTGPLPTVQVARIGRDLAGTLAAVHGVGVVHRDLKPANVMLVDGEPILIDFGIARSADEARITRTGLVMGTPGYLSPELIYGDPVTTATDWWAWGATLAFAATGRQPFGNGPIETILARVRTGECDVDGVDPPLRRLLERALTVDPDRRPTAVELLPAVDAVIAGAATEPSAVDRHRARSLDRTVAAHPPVDRTVVARPPADRSPDPAARPSAYPPPAYPPTRRASAPSPSRTPPPPPPYPPPSAHSAYPPPPQQYPQQYAQYPQHYPPQQPYPPQPYPPQYAGPGGYPQQYPPPSAQPPTVRTSPAPARASRSSDVPAPGRDAAAGPRRVTIPLTVAMAVLCLVAVVAPGGAVVLTVLWGVLARTVHRSTAGLERRRQELGRSRNDVAVTVAALPWRLLAATLVSLLAAVLPFLVYLSVALVAGVLGTTSGVSHPSRPVPLLLGMVAAIVVAWWGPGGHGLRGGTRAVARAATAGRTGEIAVYAGCTLIALAAVMVATRAGFTPDWSPFPEPGSLGRWEA